MSTLVLGPAGQVVGIDGKTVRGSRQRRCGKQAIHLVSAFVCGHGLTLGQLKTQAKSNEITAIPELVDALGCQNEISAVIVGKQADYVLALKGNRDTLCCQVKRLFDTTEQRNYRDFATMGQTTQGKDMDVWKRVVAWRYPRPSIKIPMGALACEAW